MPVSGGTMRVSPDKPLVLGGHTIPAGVEILLAVHGEAAGSAWGFASSEPFAFKPASTSVSCTALRLQDAPPARSIPISHALLLLEASVCLGCLGCFAIPPASFHGTSLPPPDPRCRHACRACRLDELRALLGPALRVPARAVGGATGRVLVSWGGGTVRSGRSGVMLGGGGTTHCVDFVKMFGCFPTQRTCLVLAAAAFVVAPAC